MDNFSHGIRGACPHIQCPIPLLEKFDNADKLYRPRHKLIETSYYDYYLFILESQQKTKKNPRLYLTGIPVFSI